MFGQLFNDDVIKNLTMMSLKNIRGWAGLFLLQENITSTVCLFTSGLNCIFHWTAHWLIRLRSLFKTVAEVSFIIHESKICITYITFCWRSWCDGKSFT